MNDLDRDAIEVILTIYYVLGDMTAQEALDEICNIVFPEGNPQSSASTLNLEEK